MSFYIDYRQPFPSHPQPNTPVQSTTTKQIHDKVDSVGVVLGDIVGVNNEAGASVAVVVVGVAI